MLIKVDCGYTRWRYSYARATVAEVTRKLGADHVAWMLSHGVERAARIAEGRAQGCWDANLLEDMSAYERLGELLRTGQITPETWHAVA